MRPVSRRRLGRGLARAGLALAGGSVLAFLIVPVISVIPMSFGSSMVFELIPTTPGLSQYRRFFSSPEWMVALGRSLEEGSRSLGAGPVKTFFRITFPQIRLAVFGGALFAFNVSFDEVVVTLFISGVHSKTLPVKVWDAIIYEITPILPAISALIIAASVLMLTPLLLYRRRS